MVDLRSQYERLSEDIDREMRSVMESTAFVKGPKVEEFAHHLEAYQGVRHVIPCGSGTDALQLALMSLELEPGDEVIVPDFTFAATAEVCALLGLRPVLVDVDWDTMNVTAKTIEQAITERTRVIVPVHLFGQNAPMEEILDVARKHGLQVVEDACQSMGSEYRFTDGRVKKSGTMGTLGCTSFFPSKNLGCYGDGGAVMTDDDELAEKVRVLANHGMKERYHYDRIGVNSRLDALQAAVLDAKLPYLDDFIRRRQAAAHYYDEHLKDDERFLLPVRGKQTTHAYHQYTLRCVGVNRDALRARLAEAGVPSMVYYPIPLHKQKAYERFLQLKDESLKLKESERLSECVLSLPMHTELTEAMLATVVKKVAEATLTS